MRILTVRYKLILATVKDCLMYVMIRYAFYILLLFCLKIIVSQGPEIKIPNLN